MAVATATALTLASIATGAAQAGIGFSEAARQKRLKKEAEAEAEQAMASARKSLEKNYMDSLAIQKEPYELEREAALVAGAQATEALRESDRGMGRVGAIYGQLQQAQRQIASAMGQEMFNLDYLSAQEDARLRDIGTQLDLGEVTGAQLAAANAEERRAQQLQAGAAGIGNAAMTGLDALALYKKTKPPTTSASGDTDMSKLVSQADLGLGKSFDGLALRGDEFSYMSGNPIMPPQLPKSDLERIMAIQQANQSRNTPIGNEPIDYIKPPGMSRFLSSLNPFNVN